MPERSPVSFASSREAYRRATKEAMMSRSTYFGASPPARAALGLAVGLLVACSATSNTPGGSGGQGGTDSGSSSTGLGGGLNPSGGAGGDVCKKIDFLFVVDN